MFRRLAVFAGGWSLEASEAVCAGDEAEDGEVLSVLSRLVDKSLVVMEERNGRARYRLLEPVRQYAQERLQLSSDLATVQERQAAFFLAITERWAGTWRARGLETQEREEDNLRAALRWCVDQGAADIRLRLARGCMWFWFGRGAFHEGQAWLRRLLAPPGAERPTAARAAALGATGNLAMRQGDFATTRAFHEQGLATAREVGDLRQLFSNLHDCGIGALYRGEYALARRHFEEAVVTARAAGDRVFEAFGLCNLGWLAEEQAEHTAARVGGDEALSLARAEGELWVVGFALNISGRALLGQGDVATARRLLEESLALERQVGYHWITAHTLESLARVDLVQEQHAEAQARFGESLALFQEVGDVVLIAQCLEGVAALAAARGQPARAFRLVGAADGLRERVGAALHPMRRSLRDHWLDPLRRVVGEAIVAQACASGHTLTLDQAVALALDRLLYVGLNTWIPAEARVAPCPIGDR